MKRLLPRLALLALLWTAPVQAALVVADRVQETSTTTGVGTLSLAGATSGYRTFVTGVGTGNITYYAITQGADWEVGIGTVTAGSPATLSRDTVIASSTGGAKVNLSSGTKNVFGTMPGPRFPVASSASPCSATNADATHFLRGDCTWQTIPGGGDALTTSPLSQFAATTSAQLAGVLTNETGSGLAVFNNSPTFITPTLGVASATSLTLGSPLVVASGGLGVGSLTVHGVVVGNGTSPLQATSSGSAGQVLTSNGSSADPTFQTVSGTGTVTSIGTNSPITGGTITTTGTISCATCTTASASLTANQLLFGAAGQALAVGDLIGDVTTSGGKTTAIGALKVTNGMLAGAILTAKMASLSGTGTTVVTTTGVQGSGNCVKIDASGNHIDNGAACGGTPSFSSVTSGTNTIAAMIVGSGASLAVSGTGTITATGGATPFSIGTAPYTGVANLGSITLNGTTSGVVSIFPYASTATYNLLLPNSAGTLGQCLTSGGGSSAMTWGTCGGAAAFSAITASTNTTAAMVVGSGASLTYSGSGTINATTVAGLTVANVWTKTVAPTASENTAAGYLTGDIWNNTTASPKTVYEKVSESAGTAVWIRLDNPDLTGDVTTSGAAATIAANAVTSAKMAVVNTRRTCAMVVGADNGSALADADIGPQRKQCQVPYAATVTEVDVAADAGTPNVIVAKRHCTVASCTTGANETVSNLVSSALAAGPGTTCSKTGATAGLDTFTTCSATLQNTSLAVGDWIELVSGTAGGTAKRLSVVVHYTVN